MDRRKVTFECVLDVAPDFEISEFVLAPSGKTVVHRALVPRERQPMPNELDTSELFKIAKLNGDFKRNYGPLLGAFLYLRSISAVRGRSWFWSGLIAAGVSGAVTWLGKQILGWLHL